MTTVSPVPPEIISSHQQLPNDDPHDLKTTMGMREHVTPVIQAV